jgi:predicted thioredoxin/glutaredoxin
VEIVLITRQGCHLCDHALTSLRSLGVEPELRDVDSDEQLHALYDWRVPVVMLDGRVVAEGRVNSDTLRNALKPA